MPRYRIRYSKEGPARFISHLDMLRTFERALRRAGLPVSLTQGFNPHPRMSFGFPLPVGMSGLNEYMDIDLDSAMPVEEIAGSLEKAMPPGFGVTGVCPVSEKAPSLMAEAERSLYSVRVDRDEVPGGMAAVKNCVEDMMNSDEINVVRRKKDGRKAVFDIRPGLIRISAGEEGGSVVLEMELMTGSSLNVRPEEVIGAMRERCGILKETGLEIVRTVIAGRGGKDLFMDGCADTRAENTV
ncbi:MAG: TIGR03936 family radical SAM-associated protein [Bacillota bacterium]